MASLEYVTCTVYGDCVTGGRPWQFSWHYRIDDPDPDGYSSLLTEAIANAVKDTLQTSGTPLLEDVLGYGMVGRWLEVRSTYPIAYYPAGVETLAIGTSGGTSDLLPEGNGPLILLQAGFPTEDYPRSGRLYWPGINEGVTGNGRIEQSYADDLQSFWLQLLSDSATIESVEYTWHMCLLSPANEAKPSQDVTNIQVADKIARLARRQRTAQGRYVS